MDGILRVALILAVVIGVPMLCVSIIPALAKALIARIEGRHDGSEEALAELEALRAEVEALRAIAPRVLELEERVDFTERLLARSSERQSIDAGSAE